jgi:hypothetical protein
MMCALVVGVLKDAPALRTSKAGREFLTATLRVLTGGERGSLFIDVMAFEAGVVESLRVMKAGAPIALSGEMTPTTWTAKDLTTRSGWRLTASAMLTPEMPKKGSGQMDYARSIAAARPANQDSRSITKLWEGEVGR